LGGRPGGRSDGRSDGRPKFKKKVRFVKNNTFASDGSGSDGFFHPLDADFRPLDAIHLSLKIKKVALEKKALDVWTDAGNPLFNGFLNLQIKICLGLLGPF
jgi:hypothetical protein